MKEQLLLIYSYLYGIWRYRWSALVIAWMVALLGSLMVYAVPNQYASKAIMHIDTKSVIRPLLKGLAVESRVESGLDIMTQLLLSQKNLEEVIIDTGMVLDADNPEAMFLMVNKLSSSVILTKQRRANIYELSYQGGDAELVYKVVSKLMNSVIETTLNSARTDTSSAQKFLERQISGYEKRLTTAEQKLAEFKQANIGLMPDATGGYYKRLQNEQAGLDKLRSELLLAERRLSDMRKQLAGESSVLGGGDYSAPQVLKLRRYREQLDLLLAQYTENHPDVKALRSSISDAVANKGAAEDDFIGLVGDESVAFNPVYQELKADIHKTSVELGTIKLRLSEKEKIVRKLKQSVDIIPEVEAKLAKLNRDYEITRERHLGLVERRESARLAQEVGQSGSNIKFRIIEPPRVATSPSEPDRVVLLIMVFVVAVAAGLGWGVFRYLLQPTFIASSQIQSKIGLPVLGSVGLYMTAEHQKRRRIQLTTFLLVFSMLIVFSGGAVLFRDAGTDLVNDLKPLTVRSSPA